MTLFGRIVNARTMEVISARFPSLACYTAAMGLFGLFFTSSWFGKNALEKVPIYNKKYDEQDID